MREAKNLLKNEKIKTLEMPREPFSYPKTLRLYKIPYNSCDTVLACAESRTANDLVSDRYNVEAGLAQSPHLSLGSGVIFLFSRRSDRWDRIIVLLLFLLLKTHLKFSLSSVELVLHFSCHQALHCALWSLFALYYRVDRLGYR